MAFERCHAHPGGVHDDVGFPHGPFEGCLVGDVGERQIHARALGERGDFLRRRPEGRVGAFEDGDPPRAVERGLSVNRRARAACADDRDVGARHGEASLGDRPQQARPVGVVADEPIALALDRVDRAHEPGRGGELVEMLDHGGLARHRHVEAREAHGARARDGGAYGRGDDVVAQVDAVEPELGEGHVVHGGGKRMLHRRAEKGKRLCAAGYHRASFDEDGGSRSDRARRYAWSDALAGRLKDTCARICRYLGGFA